MKIGQLSRSNSTTSTASTPSSTTSYVPPIITRVPSTPAAVVPVSVPVVQPAKSVPEVTQPVVTPAVTPAVVAAVPQAALKSEEEEAKRKDVEREKEVATEGLRKKVDEMAVENLELVEAIKEYQETLEIIMGKHRVLMV